VISLGDYRKEPFEGGGTVGAFEKTLFEAWAKCGWLLYAYVIMSNHYHLTVETPEANLVEGMRWLQGIFRIRFNVVIEEARPLLELVNYIHLNPRRAGIVTVARLRDYEWSRYPQILQTDTTGAAQLNAFFSALEFPDSVAGMRQYARQLEFAEESNHAVRDALARRYWHGWAVASEEHRQDLKKMYAALEEPAGWGGREVAELREEKWEKALTALLRSAGKTKRDALRAPKKGRIGRCASPGNCDYAQRRQTHGSPNA
jgi:putative transposase